MHFESNFDADEYLQDNMGFGAKYLVAKVANHTETRTGLFICAPKEMFKGENKSIIKEIPQDKDPIVFRYVRGGVQIITKWGLEASDNALINPVNN